MGKLSSIKYYNVAFSGWMYSFQFTWGTEESPLSRNR